MEFYLLLGINYFLQASCGENWNDFYLLGERELNPHLAPRGATCETEKREVVLRRKTCSTPYHTSNLSNDRICACHNGTARHNFSESYRYRRVSSTLPAPEELIMSC